MADEVKKRILVIIRRSPYGSSLAKASVDAVLAMAAFEQEVDVLFAGEGVLQLQPGQDANSLGLKNIGRQLAALPLYDVNRIYVDAEAANRYKLEMAAVSIETQLLTALDMHQLMVTYDHLLGF